MIEIYVLDGLNRIGEISHYAEATAVERDLYSGAWSVSVHYDEGFGEVVDMLAADFPGVEFYDPDTGWRFGGFLTKVVEHRTATARTVTLSGSDFQALLNYYLEWPDSEDPFGWWANTTVAANSSLTRAAYAVVRQNLGDFAEPERQLAGLALASDPGLGTDTQHRAKGDPILDLLRPSFVNTDLTCSLRLVRGFTSGVGPTASIEFKADARPVSDQIIDIETGTVETITNTLEADVATYIIGMGAEIPPGPQRYMHVAGGLGNNWRFRHREQFISRPGEIQDGIEAAVDDVFRESIRGQRVKVTGAEVGGYGSTIGIGWLVKVRVGEGIGAEFLEAPVVASTLSFTGGDGWRRSVDIGTESAEGPQLILDRVAQYRRDLRHIENEF